MKRRDLDKQISKFAQEAGVTLEFGHGKRHDIYLINGRTVPVPRHTEIGEDLVKTIMKQCRRAAGL